MKPLHILLTQMILCSALSAAGKPNIIVIMGDDMGYSDIGCSGSEIKTLFSTSSAKWSANGVRGRIASACSRGRPSDRRRSR
jgi:hypothetical protein